MIPGIFSCCRARRELISAGNRPKSESDKWIVQFYQT